MKTSFFCISILVACTASASLFAADRTNPNIPAPTPAKEDFGDVEDRDPSVPSKYVEPERKWMVGGNLGGGSFETSGKMKDEIDSYRNAYGANDRTTVHMDGFFAWRMGGGKVFLGPAIDLLYSSYDSTTNPDLSVTNIFVGGTMVFFLGEHVRRGPFIRIDAGFNDTNIASDKDKNAYADKDYGGTALHGGFGYAIPLGSKLSLPIELQYQYTSARDSSETRAALLTVGLFF
ncbi:MAG: hypothetical protein JST04_15125 [Bdellovibrionales bacterium]|nr:hypothetical protein [Bdellovibrionales bacterium]